MDNERFKMLRRNSLRLEVDGAWDELENLEDSRDVPNRVTHAECLVLQRVLSDKTKLPKCCAPEGAAQRVSLKTTASTLARRLSGGFPGAFDSKVDGAAKELGGPVSIDECSSLKGYLEPSVGGLYLLPGACSGLLQRAEQAEAEQYERENAEVYKRLKKRQTEIAKAGYPPTAC